MRINPTKIFNFWLTSERGAKLIIIRFLHKENSLQYVIFIKLRNSTKIVKNHRRKAINSKTCYLYRESQQTPYRNILLMKRLQFLILPLILITLSSFSKNVKKAQINIIPRPVLTEVHPGHFSFDNNSRIVVETPDSLHFESHYLANYLKSKGNLDLKVIYTSELKNAKHDIILKLVPGISKSNAGYQMTVNKKSVTIEANSSTGIFYGIQSLLQLFPTSFYNKNHAQQHCELPSCFIKDAPRFGYRGMHLDVSRHFFPPADIKKYLDMLAMYKMNIFHWHLTDDQGWRIQIKKYPKLTEVGAWRDSTVIGHPKRHGKNHYVVKRYGGFYTQAQIRDIVHYAAQRHITIIPEIEMPGHSEAAVASYPFLACTKGPFPVGTRWGTYRNIYCPSPQTFTFLENVLTEVMDLFPSKYIHIGGDEVPKYAWNHSKYCQQLMKKEGLKNADELQSWFIEKIEKFLNAHHRDMIGWDEILEGGLSPNATVESWRGIQGGIKAAKMGHDVIMAPGGYCYFDHYQANRKFQPIAIGGFTPLKKVYDYEPVPKALNKEEARYILGAEGEVWTEYMPTFKKVEYMVLPRMAALAEVDWTPVKRKSWPSFQRRIAREFSIYKALRYNYCPGSYKVNISTKNTAQKVQVTLQSEIYHPDIRYTTNGTIPTIHSAKYNGSFQVKPGTKIESAVFVKGKLMEEPSVKLVK